MVSSRIHQMEIAGLANLPDLQHQHTILRDGCLCCDGYPVAQFLDLRRRLGDTRACRLLETLTVPQRTESPEIVLEKHDFSYPDCTQSFFCYCEDEDDGTLLRVEQQNTTARYTVAARTLRHEQRVSCHGRHQYSHARLHAKLHTRRPCPLRCVVYHYT